MISNSGLIARLVRQSAAPRSIPGRRARPIGDASSSATIQLTLISHDDVEGGVVMGQEVEARADVKRRPGRPGGDAGFHHLAIELDGQHRDKIHNLMGSQRAPSLVLAEMPLGNQTVFTVPFQMDGDSPAMADTAPDELEAFCPTTPSVALKKREDFALLSATLKASLDRFADDLGGPTRLRASLPLPLVEACIWPTEKPPARPVWQMYADTREANYQRYAVILADHDELVEIHAKVVKTLDSRIGEWLAAGHRQAEAYISEDIANRQASIASWQALAGSDTRRGLAAGQPVCELAKLYFNEAIISWGRFQYAQEILNEDNVSDALLTREIIHRLEAIANPQDNRAMLEAVKNALEDRNLNAEFADAEHLLTVVSRRLDGL